MTSATEFAEVIKFRFGAPVVASDGASGSVDHVIVDPAAGTITHAGIKLSWLRSRTYSVPVDVVKGARGGGIELSITRAEIAGKSQNIPANLVRWNGATTVAAAARPIGRLAQLTARQDTHALIHLIVGRGLTGGEVVLAATAITQIAAKRITTNLSATQSSQLPVFRPDQVLEREVNEALYNYSRLRVDLRGIVVRAIDGNVWLRGHISSDLNRRVAMDQLTGIAGLWAVQNHLIADTDLAAAVASALARDARTREQHIGVYPDLGTIVLRGMTQTAEAREAASQVVAGVAGVEKVVNELVVSLGAEVVPVLSSVTSRAEMVPGGR